MNKTLTAISLAIVASTTIAATATPLSEENFYDQWYGAAKYSTPAARTNVPTQAILDVKLVDEETFHAHRFDGTKAPATSVGSTAIIDEETYHTLRMGIAQPAAAPQISVVAFESTVGCKIKTSGHCV